MKAILNGMEMECCKYMACCHDCFVDPADAMDFKSKCESGHFDDPANKAAWEASHPGHSCDEAIACCESCCARYDRLCLKYS